MADISAIDRRKKDRIIEYTLRVQWNGSESLKETIHRFSFDFERYGEVVPHTGTAGHIKMISIIGINLMKIIAKKYSKKLGSVNFGDDQRLIKYTENFWKVCFADRREMKAELRIFFESIEEHSSNEDIDRFVSTVFTKKDNNPANIFLKISSNIAWKTNRQEIYLFSWYFAFFRTIVYFPELFSIKGYLPGNYLKKFIEGGILYFLQKYKV
ncbi:expressed protein [Phakopsora pachyrhizi]|uniref:Expressed protein n=1 Tax=Phakopsora pachyrhizi TaxID=170000 RepID=A0AAV0AI95_PHAPC|nr:expressed protein [Phakopsora pachyrhizi]